MHPGDWSDEAEEVEISCDPTRCIVRTISAELSRVASDMEATMDGVVDIGLG